MQKRGPKNRKIYAVWAVICGVIAIALILLRSNEALLSPSNSVEDTLNKLDNGKFSDRDLEQLKQIATNDPITFNTEIEKYSKSLGGDVSCADSMNSDINKDGLVNVDDFIELSLNWGDPENENADINGDGIVNVEDLILLFFYWGPVDYCQCSDGIDNDRDGDTDFPNDDGCESPEDEDEEGGIFGFIQVCDELADINLNDNIIKLDEVRNDLTASYIQTCNIDLDGIEFEPIGTFEEPFAGVYNGDGYETSNLNINLPNNDYVGLFGKISAAMIKNVTLINANVAGNNEVGGLAGSSENSILESNSISGFVTGDVSVGGFVGYSDNSSIISSFAKDIDVNGGSHDIGGLAGLVYFGEIIGSYASGKADGNAFTGGLVGSLKSGRIERSYSNTFISSLGGDGIGGLVGSLSNVGNGPEAVILDSYSLGDIETNDDRPTAIGGLVGLVVSTTGIEIVNSYSIGGDSDSNGVIGGFVGRVLVGNPEITNSYWDIEISGLQNGCGLGDCSGVEGKTTAEMKMQSTYEPEWDFETIWDINEGISYPYLQWQI